MNGMNTVGNCKEFFSYINNHLVVECIKANKMIVSITALIYGYKYFRYSNKAVIHV